MLMLEGLKRRRWLDSFCWTLRSLSPVWGHPSLPTKEGSATVVEKAEHGVLEAGRVDEGIITCLRAMVSAGAVQALYAVRT